MTHPTDAEIDAATNAPFTPERAELLPGDPDRKVPLSARVPDAVSTWIYQEALRRRISPSLLTAELLGEAIAARQQAAGQPARRLVDIDAVHRAIDRLSAAA
jgi:hypothetical protein